MFDIMSYLIGFEKGGGVVIEPTEVEIRGDTYECTDTYLDGHVVIMER